jgi:hypothetical protein
MKKNLNRTLMLTAAVLTLGAAAAYGQNRVTADVPFSYRIVGAELPAGEYAVMQQGPFTMLRNVANGQAKMAMTTSRVSEAKDRGARLVFRCGDESGCSLAQVWTGDGNGWQLYTPRLTAGEKERLAVVFITHRYEGE